MAVTTKVVSGSIQTITCRQYFQGSVTNTTTRQVYRDRATATAEFRRRRPQVLTDTPMVIDMTANNPGHYRTGNPKGFERAGTQLYVHNSVPVVFYRPGAKDGESERNAALANFSEFTFGESLAEAGDTYNYLSKRLGNLYDIGFALYRGDVKKLERIFKQSIPRDAKGKLHSWDASKRLANGHLEVAFGITPIVNDMVSASRAYVQGLATRGQTVVGRSGSTSRRKPDAEWKHDFHDNRASAVFRGVVTNESLAQLNQLGLLNFPLQVWNKLPYSFVFDWFIPVGTFLGAATASAGLSEFRGCKTVESWKFGSQTVNGKRLLWEKSLTVTRTPLYSPFPTLAGLIRQSSGSFGQLVTLASLMRQRLS